MFFKLTSKLVVYPPDCLQKLFASVGGFLNLQDGCW